MRLPAQALEDAVLQTIRRFLGDQHRLMEVMGEVEAVEARRRLHRASSLAEQLASQNSTQKIEILQRIVHRIAIHEDSLKISIKADSVWGTQDAAVNDERLVLVEMPVRLKRCGSAMRLVLGTPAAGSTRRPDPKLVGLVAKAHDWFGRLSGGTRDGVMAIATEEQVSSAYVTRVMHLAFLAPDIVQRIHRGEQPVELNANRLIRLGPLPLDWVKQRALLGMG